MKYLICLFVVLAAASCGKYSDISVQSVDFSAISEVKGSGAELMVKFYVETDTKLRFSVAEVDITLQTTDNNRLCSVYSNGATAVVLNSSGEVVIPLEITFPGGVAGSDRAVKLLSHGQTDSVVVSGYVTIRKGFIKKRFCFDKKPLSYFMLK